MGRQRGFTLLTTGMCVFAMIGMLGLAVDLGRMYIVKNELQTFTDSAALAAVMELDGTTLGITRAQNAVASNTNTYNLGNNAVTNPTVDFAADASGPWVSSPLDASGYRYARVRATGNLGLLFMPAVVSTSTANIGAASVGGQQLKTGFRYGLFPFSPLAHNNGPEAGLTRGSMYTLRWPANPKSGQNVCPGDDLTNIIVLSEAGGGSERGYIEDTSASAIRNTIVWDYQTIYRAIGDSVSMTGGAKQTERDAILSRISQDTDTTSTTLATYTGNGRRIVGCPINTGFPDYTIVQIGAFLLLPQDYYDMSGNQPFCGVYLGPWLEGGRRPGAGTGAGAYVARLVQ